jgi:hypothetical protein
MYMCDPFRVPRAQRKIASVAEEGHGINFKRVSKDFYEFWDTHLKNFLLIVGSLRFQWMQTLIVNYSGFQTRGTSDLK